MGTFNPHSTVRAPYFENLYDCLTRLGWTKTGGNSRWSFYGKKNWRVCIPHNVNYPIRFYRAVIRIEKEGGAAQ